MLNIFDIFSSGNRTRPSGRGYLYAIAGLVIVLGLIVLFVFEIPHFSNTLEVKSLVLKALLFGALLGGGIGWWLSRPVFELLDKVKIIVALLFFCMIFMPTFASLSNRVLSPHPVEMREARLVTKEAFISDRFGNYIGQDPEPTGYYTQVLLDGKIFRIRTKKDNFAGARKDDIIKVPLRKGFWGYYFINLD